MGLKIILSVTEGEDRGEVPELLQRYGFTFTALLQLALIHWESMKFLDPEVLRAAVEGAAAQQLTDRIYTYEEFNVVVHAICQSIHHIHDIIDQALSPILNTVPHNGDLTVRFVRWLASSAVVEIDPRLT